MNDLHIRFYYLSIFRAKQTLIAEPFSVEISMESFRRKLDYNIAYITKIFSMHVYGIDFRAEITSKRNEERLIKELKSCVIAAGSQISLTIFHDNV